MAIVSASGSLPSPPFPASTPLLEVPYGVPRNAVAVLNSFLFSFAVGVDNHVNTIEVLPGGDSQDLSPSEDTSPEVVGDGRLRLMFSDRDLDHVNDFYHYRVSHAVFPTSVARRFQVRGNRCRGRCRRNVSTLFPTELRQSRQPSLLALCGFKLFFPSGVDHHLDEVDVTIHDDGELVVALNDRNNDDPFGYVVDFARMGLVGMNVIAGESSGFDEFHQHAHLPSLSHGEFVLRGFRIRYLQPLDQNPPQVSDRHLLRVGVVHVPDVEEIQVIFRDADGSEPFEWRVRWALVAPQVVAPV